MGGQENLLEFLVRGGCSKAAYVPMQIFASALNGEKEQSSPKFYFWGIERGFCLVTGSPAGAQPKRSPHFKMGNPRFKMGRETSPFKNGDSPFKNGGCGKKMGININIMAVDGPSYLVGRTDARVRTMFCQGTKHRCLWTGPMGVVSRVCAKTGR